MTASRWMMGCWAVLVGLSVGTVVFGAVGLWWGGVGDGGGEGLGDCRWVYGDAACALGVGGGVVGVAGGVGGGDWGDAVLRGHCRSELVRGVHIRCCGNGFLWFRSYSDSLLNSAKVSKTLLPHHLAPRSGSVCPLSGIAPWAAATGHPWPNAAIPASMPGYPLRNACVRPAWLTGRLRSKSKTEPLSVGASLLAKNLRSPRGVRFSASSLTIFASKLAPTERRHVRKRSGRLLGRLALFLILILGAPLTTMAVVRY